MRRLARRSANRVVVAVGLALALPAIAVAERLRRGTGRRVALVAIRTVSRLCGVRFAVTGASQLSEACDYVFVPNHSSPLDIPAMLLARPDVRFVAAAELFRIPLLAGAMRALDSVPVDRKDVRAARRQLSALSDGPASRCVAIFAEGGIAPVGQRLPFRSGAFAVAIESSASVVPVAIRGTDAVLPPGAKFAVVPGTVHVEMLEPIPTDGLSGADRKRLRDDTEAAVLAALAG